ncbi:MAG: transglutaminase-like domain-containing protein [Planctomycetaceae bacterium]
MDFVINRKGHCEYFASALVLMLRSIGIPARYVNGFKGGTLNTKTGQRIEFVGCTTG